MIKGYLRVIVAVAIVGAITSCQTAEDEKISAARACTDRAAKGAYTNPTQAAAESVNCDALIVGVSTPEANKIRFGNFLLFNQKMARIGELANTMKAPATGNPSLDGLNTAFTILIVSSTEAARGLAIARGTGSAGINTVADLINVSSSLSSIANIGISPSDDGQAVKTKINNCVASCTAGEKQQLADTILSAQSSACASPTDAASTDPNNPCVIMMAITQGSTNATTIVANLNTYLASNH